jgi:hypothetical protein
MGSEAVLSLLSKAKKRALRSQMTRQLDGYERHAAEARRELVRLGTEPKEESLPIRMTLRVEMALQTLFGADSDRIAELLIKEANTNITDMTRLLNSSSSGGQTADICKRLIEFESESVAELKRFL